MTRLLNPLDWLGGRTLRIGVTGLARAGKTAFLTSVAANLLADAGFVLPPELDRLAAGALRDRGRNEGGEVFLCACCAAASA